MIKYYLIFLSFIIMGVGARTMFEVAYQGVAFEHDTLPNKKVAFLMGVAVWFIIMMAADIWAIMHDKLSKSLLAAGLLSAGVFVPALYMFLHRW